MDNAIPDINLYEHNVVLLKKSLKIKGTIGSRK